MRQLRPALFSSQFATASGNLLQIAVAHFGEVLGGIYRRQIRHRPELVRFKRVELQCILEQIPDPDSRITLAKGSVDALGMPLSRIHWKKSQLELHTARRMSEIVSLELQRLGLPVPEPTPWLDDDNWRAHFFERAHPAGTTRMSSDPKGGVVDPNGQVHGISGLFLAGSSVFPTSGAANPTLMIVAMALRLADWLKQHLFTFSAIEPISISVPSSREESRITPPSTSVPMDLQDSVSAFQKSTVL
jgi:choline dehydrogenase-like flavoprotein